MGRKNIYLLVWEGKRKEKWNEMSKTASKTDKNWIKCPKMQKKYQKLSNFATTKDTKRKGKYQMPNGKGKGKREIPKTKRKREKEKKFKSQKEKGKRKREIPKSKKKRKREKEILNTEGKEKGGKLTFSFPILQGKGIPVDLWYTATFLQLITLGEIM